MQRFIDRWSKSAGAERANYQLFLAELCDALDVARPEPTVEDDAHNAYVVERGVRFDNRDGTYSIDLYKRGAFVVHGLGRSCSSRAQIASRRAAPRPP